MDGIARQHWVNRCADGAGALALGAASATLTTMFYHAVPVAAAAGVSGLIGGWTLLRRVSARTDAHGFAFEAPSFDFTADELLLEDRLEDAPVDSRVVQLFAADATPALPRPGDLAERIDRWLGEGRGVADATPLPTAARPRPDATAELHQALADIRRSLR